MDRLALAAAGAARVPQASAAPLPLPTSFFAQPELGEPTAEPPAAATLIPKFHFKMSTETVMRKIKKYNCREAFQRQTNGVYF